MGLILEGLIFGGKIAFQNRLGLFVSQNRLGYLIVGRKFISVICRTVLLNLTLRTYTFLKRSNASTLSVWTEEIQTRMKSELRKQQYTVFLTVIIWLVLWQIQKLCYCTVIGLFSLYLRANSKYKPRGIIFGGAI